MGRPLVLIALLSAAPALGQTGEQAPAAKPQTRYLEGMGRTAEENDLYEEISRALFRVADAMLQNSGREPFGLVGLEVMAAGGLVFTGATGEESADLFGLDIAF